MPRRTECVFGCPQFYVLHRFPKPVDFSLERFLEWKRIVGQKVEDKTNDDIYANYRICNHHFEERFFYPHSKRLAKTAFPTLQLGSFAPSVQDSQRPDYQAESSVEIQPLPQAQPEGSVFQVPNPKQLRKHKAAKAIKRKPSKQTMLLLKKLVTLRNKLKEQKDQMKAAQKISKTKLFNKVLKSLPAPTLTFIKMQLTQHFKKVRGRRFSLEDKLLALSIYKKSPKAYNFLRKLFTLPSKRTLQDVLKLITLKPGLNPVIQKQIKDAVEGMTTEQRLCVLMFDEMALSSSMHYNIHSDQIIGFEDFGGNDTTENIADHVLVLMVKGVKYNFKQPIFYGFCKSATKAVILKKIIKNAIEELFQAGLTVVATVCDQSTINTKVVEDLILETKGEYLRSNKELRYNAFEINNKKIFPLFDAPHLLKCIRNNLLLKELRFTQDDKVKTAKWEHLKMLLEIDVGEDEMRMCNKLTEAHVLPEKIPKMKVKHAAQVFSQRVSGALRFCARNSILPQECTDTADLLLLFDQLFDSFNAGSYKKTYKIYKNYIHHNSEHFTLWNKTLPILRSMGFKTENKKRDGSKSITYAKVPSIKNWIHNIITVKDLWQYLSKEYKITSLLMRNFNQDPVENFFSSVRSHGARNTNPTCFQFESIYKTLVVNNLSSNHSLGANCEEDANKMLHNLDILLAKCTPQAPRNDEQIGEDFNLEILSGSTGLSCSQEEDKLVHETKRYTGHCPMLKFKFGKCYGDNTRQILREIRSKGLFSKPLQYRPGDNYELERARAQRSEAPLHDVYDGIRHRETARMTGYTGYVPGLNFRYGKSYGRAADDCMADFSEQQRDLRRKADFNRSYTRSRSAPKMETIHTRDEIRRDLSRFREINKYKENTISPEFPPIAGYTGHIPRIKGSEASLSQRYHCAAKRGLELINIERNKRKELINADTKIKAIIKDHDKKYSYYNWG